MVSKTEVMKKIEDVIDPELGVNIVDLGLIYGVEIKGKNVLVKMTFTTPACPLGGYLIQNVKDKVGEIEGIKTVEVEMVWDPPWTPERMNKKVRDLLNPTTI